MRFHLYLAQKFDLHGFKGFHQGFSKIYISPKTRWDKEFKKWKLMVNKEEDPIVDWISHVLQDTNVPSLRTDDVQSTIGSSSMFTVNFHSLNSICHAVLGET
ncbi:hypothetical protein PS2_033805 [Malus domestica]